MEALKPEVLLWSYFAWLVAKEAPEAFWAYVLLYDRMQGRRRAERHDFALRDTVTLTENWSITRIRTGAPEEIDLNPIVEAKSVFLKLSPVRGNSSISLESTTGGCA